VGEFERRLKKKPAHHRSQRGAFSYPDAMRVVRRPMMMKASEVRSRFLYPSAGAQGL
jgi:hypothetical protein